MHLKLGIIALLLAGLYLIAFFLMIALIIKLRGPSVSVDRMAALVMIFLFLTIIVRLFFFAIVLNDAFDNELEVGVVIGTLMSNLPVVLLACAAVTSIFEWLNLLDYADMLVREDASQETNYSRAYSVVYVIVLMLYVVSSGYLIAESIINGGDHYAFYISVFYGVSFILFGLCFTMVGFLLLRKYYQWAEEAYLKGRRKIILSIIILTMSHLIRGGVNLYEAFEKNFLDKQIDSLDSQDWFLPIYMLCLYLLGDLFPIFAQTFSMFYAVSEQMNELNAYQTILRSETSVTEGDPTERFFSMGSAKMFQEKLFNLNKTRDTSVRRDESTKVVSE